MSPHPVRRKILGVLAVALVFGGIGALVNDDRAPPQKAPTLVDAPASAGKAKTPVKTSSKTEDQQSARQAVRRAEQRAAEEAAASSGNRTQRGRPNNGQQKKPHDKLNNKRRKKPHDKPHSRPPRPW